MNFEDLGYSEADVSSLHPVVQKVIQEKLIKRNNNTPDAIGQKFSLLTYEVKFKDTILGIALKFSTTTRIIEHMNHIEDHSLIPGQELVLLPGCREEDMNKLDDIRYNFRVMNQTRKYADALTLSVTSSSALGALSKTVYSDYGENEVEDDCIGVISEAERRMQWLEQQKAASTSVIPFAVRSYLRFKRGYMLESAGFKKFVKVWCVLVDQHLIVYSRKMDRLPKRIIYLHGRRYRITQTQVTLCILFDMDLMESDTPRLPTKVFYQLESTKEASDWKELLSMIAVNSVGTSIRDDTQLPFDVFFRDITCLPWRQQRLEMNSASGYHSDVDGTPILFCATGDPPADNALDAIWDVQNGQFALEERSDVILRIVLQCRDFLRHEGNLCTHQNLQAGMKNDTVPDHWADSADEKQADVNIPHDKEDFQLDSRLQAFIQDMHRIPYWPSSARVTHGSQLLLNNIVSVVQELVCGAAVEVVCSSEGAALLAGLAASSSYSNPSPPSPSASSLSAHEEALLANFTIADDLVSAFLIRWIRSLYFCLRSFAINGIRVNDECMHRFIEMRMELAVTRRLILSVCGVGWWDDSLWGMPLNENFMLYCLKLATVASIKSLQRVTAKLTDENISDIIHVWAFVGQMLGIRGEPSLHLISVSDLLMSVHDESIRRRNPCLHQGESFKTQLYQTKVAATPLAPQSSSKEAYYRDIIPHQDIAFTVSTVNSIIDTALQFPFSSSWIRNSQWSRQMLFTWARQYQSAIRNTPFFHSHALPFYILPTLWIIVVTRLWVLLAFMLPMSWRRAMIEDSGSESYRLKCFLNIDVDYETAEVPLSNVDETDEEDTE